MIHSLCVTARTVTVCHIELIEFLLGRLLSQSNNIRRGNVRPSVAMFIRTYVCTSIRLSTKYFSDCNDIWYVDRGQGQGHDCLKATQ